MEPSEVKHSEALSTHCTHREEACIGDTTNALHKVDSMVHLAIDLSQLAFEEAPKSRGKILKRRQIVQDTLLMLRYVTEAEDTLAVSRSKIYQSLELFKQEFNKDSGKEFLGPVQYESFKKLILWLGEDRSRPFSRNHPNDVEEQGPNIPYNHFIKLRKSGLIEWTERRVCIGQPKNLLSVYLLTTYGKRVADLLFN